MDLWDEHDHQDRIEKVLKKPYLMFFIKDGEVFGATEEGRVGFARFKDGEGDGFLATNLTKKVKGEKGLAYITDKNIEIIDEDKAKELL